MFRTICAACVFLAITSVSYAGDCESVISLSKITTATTASQSEFIQHASNFCKEYSLHKADSSNYDFGASYKFLAATFSTSSASVEDVASRYCSAENSSSASASAYQQYIEAIAPGAYQAYRSCIAHSQASILFTINEGSILPKDFSMTVSYKPNSASSVVVESSTSEGVSCTWNNNNSKTPSIKSIKAQGSAILKCSRPDSTKKASITVLATSMSVDPIVIAWPAYDNDGYPVDTMSAMTQKIVSLDSAIKALKTDLSSAIQVLNTGLVKKLDSNNGVNGVTCRDIKTMANDDGKGNVFYLDRHTLECTDGEYLTRFHLNRPSDHQIQLVGKCCKAWK